MTDALVQKDHPDTSHAAAASLSESHLSVTKQTILDIIRLLKGLTDEQISDVIDEYDIPISVNARRARRVNLVDDGLIVDSGERRVTKSGRLAIVWEAVSDGC